MDPDIEGRIGELACRQHGVVTCAQLSELGLSPGVIRRRVVSGRLRRLHRGVFLVGPFIPQWATEMAAVLACGPTAVLGYRSAAVLWTLLPSSGKGVVDVIVPRGHDRRRAGIRARRSSGLRPDERTMLNGIPITTFVRTLIDVAPECETREIERGLALAEREHGVTRDGLPSMLRRYRGRRGIQRLRAALKTAGGPALTRSEAEARFLDLVRRSGLPAPRVNASVGRYEIDFLWSAECLAVEIDGYRYHSSVANFEADRRRAADLASRGIQVIALTWRQVVEDGIATAVQLGQALTHARMRR